MGVMNLCMKKNPLSRTYHLIVLVPCFLLLVFAAIVLGVFVTLHLRIRDSSASDDRSNTCILFASLNGDKTGVKYSSESPCDVLIWGHVAMAASVVVLGAVLIIKAFAGIKVFSVFSIIELLNTALGLFFSLALAVMVTVGLDDTCDAFIELNELRGELFKPCEEFQYAENSGIYFYDTLNTTRILTWIEAVGFFLLVLGYGFINLLTCCVWFRSSGQPTAKKI